MTSALHHLTKRLMRAAIAVCMALSILFLPLSAEAAKTSMSGDYLTDTVSVARSLQETIEIPDEAENRAEAKDEALFLITDYISRYRNRPQVNGSMSFTTMQTALNALAGHYKTFANRPVPSVLKERLNKELAKAEKLALKES